MTFTFMARECGENKKGKKHFMIVILGFQIAIKTQLRKFIVNCKRKANNVSLMKRLETPKYN